MVAYIVNMFIMRRSTADIGHSRGNQRYIRQPRYIAGLIYGPRGPCYNAVALYRPNLVQIIT